MDTQTYDRPGKKSHKPLFRVLHIPCQGWEVLLLGLGMAFSSSCSQDNPSIPFLPEAARVLAASFPSPEKGREALFVRARTAAVRLHSGTTVEEIEPLRAELLLTTRALAALDGAAAFPWSDWIEESRFTLPDFAEQELLCATHLLPQTAALLLCRRCDFREMPAQVRMVAHQFFWRADPYEAYARGRNMLFQEHSRARDRIRPLYVETILVPNPNPLIEDLLLDIATEDSMEPRARSLAVRSLRDRGSQEAPAILESLFDTEATNFLVRKEALLAILVLDPERGHQMLLNKMPSRSIEPGTWKFMYDLRQREGLPLPAKE